MLILLLYYEWIGSLYAGNELVQYRFLISSHSQSENVDIVTDKNSKTFDRILRKCCWHFNTRKTSPLYGPVTNKWSLDLHNKIKINPCVCISEFFCFTHINLHCRRDNIPAIPRGHDVRVTVGWCLILLTVRNLTREMQIKGYSHGYSWNKVCVCVCEFNIKRISYFIITNYYYFKLRRVAKTFGISELRMCSRHTHSHCLSFDFFEITS